YSRRARCTGGTRRDLRSRAPTARQNAGSRTVDGFLQRPKQQPARVNVRKENMKTIVFICVGFALVTGRISWSAEAKLTDQVIGTWTCLSATVNGKPLSEAKIRKLRLTLT